MSSGKIWLRPPVLLALCLVSVGGVVTVLGRLATGPAVAPKRVELTNEAGSKAYPAFAPDGQRLAYSGRAASAKDDAYHIYVRDIRVDGSQQLTSGAASDLNPVWSPDGSRIAFVRIEDGKSECVVMDAAGGGEPHTFPGCASPGDETQPFAALAWMHDGQSLVAVQSAGDQPPALAVLSLSDGKFRPLTHPPAGTQDTTPAVSPDGATVAFVRNTGGDNANIFVFDSAGANPPHAVTFDGREIRNIAWTRDGQDLVYTGRRVGMWRLWRVQAYGGSPKDLIIAGRDPQYVAVSPAGNRLVYSVSPEVSSIWRGGLEEQDKKAAQVILRSSGREFCPRYSPDGKTIADISDQSGNDEIWLSDAEGGKRVQLTSFQGPSLSRVRWSPDGKSLIFDVSGDGGTDLYTVAAGGGAKPVRVREDALNGSWSRDGKTIYFQARNQVWKSQANGENAEQITHGQGSAQPLESVDGKYLIFRRWGSIWRMPLEGGEEEEFVNPDRDLMWATTLQPAKDGLYYLEFERSTREPVVTFFDYTSKKSSVVFHLTRSGGRDTSYSVSPDGKYVLYPRIDQSQTNLELVENFR